MRASIDLAERAGIGAGLRGNILCCGTGGGMQALLRFRNVASMVGVDATERNICGKNEELVVRNSLILNSNIINYTPLAREGGLILHFTAGIG
jgi:hypothetical protein